MNGYHGHQGDDSKLVMDPMQQPFDSSPEVYSSTHPHGQSVWSHPNQALPPAPPYERTILGLRRTTFILSFDAFSSGEIFVERLPFPLQFTIFNPKRLTAFRECVGLTCRSALVLVGQAGSISRILDSQELTENIPAPKTEYTHPRMMWLERHTSTTTSTQRS